MKFIQNYRNGYGCIGNRTTNAQGLPVWDFGDSAQRDGTFLISRALETKPELNGREYQAMMSRHEVVPGLFVRQADAIMWWGLTSTMSRDQFKPLIIAMGFHKDSPRLWRTLWGFCKRFFFCQNTRGNWDDAATKLPDFAGPDVWGNFIRSFRCYLLWPLLVICDLFILGNTLVRIYKSRKDFDDVGDDLNLTLDLVQAFYFLPTFFSLLARKLYFKYRPAWKPMVMTSGKEIDPESFGPQYAWDWYFRQLEAPPMNDIIKPQLESMK